MGMFDKLFKPNVEKTKAKKDVEGLIRTLAYKKYYDEGLDVQASAAAALGEIGDKRAVEPLISALRGDLSHSPVPGAAEHALVQIGEPAVKPLIQALKSEDIDVRARAARILGMIGDERAVEPLFHALKDDIHVQGRAAEALEEIGGPAVEYLFRAWETGHAEHVALVALRNMRARGRLREEALRKLKKLDYIIV